MLRDSDLSCLKNCASEFGLMHRNAPFAIARAGAMHQKSRLTEIVRSPGCRAQTAKGFRSTYASTAAKLIGIFLADKLVEAGLHLEQGRIEWSLASVARTKIKTRVSRNFVLRSEIIERVKCRAPQARGNQCGSSRLAETNEEIAPAKIDDFQRLPGPAQSVVPRKVMV